MHCSDEQFRTLKQKRYRLYKTNIYDLLLLQSNYFHYRVQNFSDHRKDPTKDDEKKIELKPK